MGCHGEDEAIRLLNEVADGPYSGIAAGGLMAKKDVNNNLGLYFILEEWHVGL